MVHPRTFNTLRRIREEDGAVLDEEESRAELAGPELLLKQLKELLNRQGSEHLESLPDGIHSGIRRQRCNGVFFYFQAPRLTGEGRRHFWRYIDAGTHKVLDNRYEIAQMISCQPDELRYIGEQDVFLLQEKIIDDILASERDAAAKAAAPTTIDPIQQVVAESLKDALRRQAIERDIAKKAIRFVGEPMGKALHVKLKKMYVVWQSEHDDALLSSSVAELADEYSKSRGPTHRTASLRREELQLICFEYVTG